MKWHNLNTFISYIMCAIVEKKKNENTEIEYTK